MGLDHAKRYLADMAEELDLLENREEQLITLREYGEYLDVLSPEKRTRAVLVPGCASATYVDVMLDDNGCVTFSTFSESFISKGYLYILTEALNGCTAQEILKDVEPIVQDFAAKAGVRLSMIASRANVFERIFHFMQKQTLAIREHQE
jgi:sulfur transfer protein SufE